MVSSAATTPDEYLSELPEDRAEVLRAVRRVILDCLPPGFEEGMEFGMISYHVPLERFPDTYNGRPLAYVALAAQKRHFSLYLMGVYDEELQREFADQWEATGRKLDMGKACVRFRKLDDLALDVVGDWVARWSVDDLIAAHRAGRERS
ncbi:uncharacterized protein DUF1801 [Nocardiopsis sp. Huas11]|uniref:DUF1801 domain-containing protein n=1 Tax=Nocardiopsis sp. Huas11 TaxID=2183912 RepID=UPI000EB55F1C|nr:DUF1801 domain-containing protein [Nocardiopsis sp. Huas11]RKS07288.1 uncharacterized protein DUF1801 [Nocardiopsis sp. Huas11]